MAKRILILGAQGMLGTQLARIYRQAIAWDKGEVDVLDAKAFEAQLSAVAAGLDAVVNCVAFNDVDGAEDRPEAAFELNGSFPGRLAELCRKLELRLVHFSTNYVFDGRKGEYRESDTPNPLSVYARSKLRGERTVAAAMDEFYIVRTAVRRDQGRHPGRNRAGVRAGHGRTGAHRRSGRRARLDSGR